MGDNNTASFVISFDGKQGDLLQVVNAIKTQIKSAVSDIEATSAKIELFKDVQAKAKAASDAFFSTREAVVQLGQQIARVQADGSKIGTDLTRELNAAERAAAAASKEYNAQSAQLKTLDAALRSAGVNMASLRTEEVRLANAAHDAAAAALEQSQKTQLGFKTLSDVSGELEKARIAYLSLRDSGKLSFVELSALQDSYGNKVAEIKGKTAGLSSTIADLQIKTLLYVEAGRRVVDFMRDAVQASNEFQLSLTQIGTISHTNEADLAALGAGAQKLAAEIGFDLTDGLKALYEIIRSGVPSPNALDVLAVSAEASKASLTDLQTTVKLGTTILNGYGKEAGDLPHIFDALFQATKDGGPTFAEMSQSIGELLPIARSARVPLEDLIATLVTLRKSGLDSSTAVTTVQRVLSNLADPANAKRLQDLGISVDGLIGTIAQIGEKKLALDQLKEIIPDARSLRAVAGLTQNFEGLRAELDRVTNSAGSVKQATDALADTPHERIDRFEASLHNLKITLGEAAGNGSALLPILTAIINRVTEGEPKFAALKLTTSALFSLLGGFAGNLTGPLASFQIFLQLVELNAAAQKRMADELARTRTEAASTGTALQAGIGAILSDVKSKADAVESAIAQTRIGLKGVVEDLAKQVSELSTVSRAEVTEFDAVTKAVLGSIDLQIKATDDRKEASIAAERALGEERLRLINETSKKILDAFDAEQRAKIKAAGDSKEQVTNIERDGANARAQILQGIVAAYRQQVDALVATERGYIDKVKSIDQERVDVNRSIQSQIDGIFAQGIGAYAAYGQKVSQIEALIADSRKATAAGEVDLAKKYVQEALGLINGIGSAVTENNRVEVDADSARIRQIGLLEEAQAQFNKVLDRQKEIAIEGRDATAATLKDTQDKLAEVSTAYEALQAKVAKGLQARIDVDVTQIDEASRKLDAEISEKARLAKVALDLTDAKAEAGKLADALKNGLTDAATEGANKVQEALLRVSENAPELSLKVDSALVGVGNVQAAILKLAEIQVHPKADIESNEEATRASILSLNGLNTESTHTIHIVKVEENALGGMVGWSRGVSRQAFFGGAGVQQFATGGPVFRRPSWSKVPGTGDGDTVPASLQAGSYVVRKAASRFYGDGLMARVAGVQAFAEGGKVKDSLDATNIQRDAGALRAGPELGAPTLPSDDSEKASVIADYVFEVGRRAQQDDFFYWRDWLKRMQKQGQRYQENPSDTNLMALLSVARTIGLNLGITHGEFRGFDVDGRTWHRTRGTDHPDGLAGLGDTWEFYAGGGRAAPQGSDTVPAMLTPGEFVMRAPVVSKLGAGLFEAINSMQVSRAQLERIVAAPRVARFADGGLVKNIGGTGNLIESLGGLGNLIQNPNAGDARAQRLLGPIEININAADLLSPDAVRRAIVPVLDDLIRRKGS